MSKIARLFKLGGAAGGFMAATSLIVSDTEMKKKIDTEMKNKIRIPFSLLAKTIDKENVITNDLYHGTGIKWDSNWDHREPKSLVKPLKENASDEEKSEYKDKLTANTAKANRIIVMVRHGQYNLDGTQDTERYI